MSPEKLTLTQQVSLIITLLQGNEMDDDDRGLIGIVNDLKADMAKIKSRELMMWGAIVVLSFFAGIGIGDVKDALKILF